jgi:hypothetical protein
MRLNKAICLIVLMFAGLLVSTSQAQDVRILHSVELNRDGRYTAHVMITNMTSTTIPNWTMSFRMDSHVERIEHAGWSEFQNAFTVNGQGWTRSIAPGEVAWFTISGLSYNGNVEVPRNCFFNGAACVVEGAPQPVVEFAQPSDMIVSAWIDESDPTTYSGYIVVQNPTELDFPPLWDLKFSTPSLIVQMDEVIWSRSGSDYQVYGHAHTDSIGTHDFALIPFRGVHTGIPSLPTNCRLNGVACSFVTPDQLIETPWMNVFIKMGEYTDTIWEGYIRIENPTNYELSSWTLRFDSETPITEMDGMTWNRVGNSYTVRPDFGRGRILEKSEYTFRIAGTWSDEIKEPSECSINGKQCLLKVQVQQKVVESDSTDADTTTGGGTDTGGGDTGGGTTVSCDNPGTTTSILPTIDFRFLSVQAASYIGFIDIINNSSSVIKDWALEFKLVDGMTVSSMNPANWTELGGNYRVLPTATNNCITPGATIRINVVGTHNGNFGEPIGCNFGGNICIFQRGFSTASEDEVQPAESATLHAAYPNPFNPQASISFEMGISEPVRVELWDALGRLRDTLYSGFAAAGQLTTVQIDGSALASGMYFVRLTSESGAMQMQKVILQK